MMTRNNQKRSSFFFTEVVGKTLPRSTSQSWLRALGDHEAPYSNPSSMDTSLIPISFSLLRRLAPPTQMKSQHGYMSWPVVANPLS